MKRKILLLPLLMLVMAVGAQTPSGGQGGSQAGQSAHVSTFHGVVTDPSGEPLIGASVVVQGTTNGTITDYLCRRRVLRNFVCRLSNSDISSCG